MNYLQFIALSPWYKDPIFWFNIVLVGWTIILIINFIEKISKWK